MNRDEAKNILLLYRTEADVADPQIAEALALVKTDAELSRWFEEHRAAQNALREKFRQIEIPGGLLQQIISEQKAKLKTKYRPDFIAATVAVMAIVVAVIFMARSWPASKKYENVPNTFANYEKRMITIATADYAMDLATTNLMQIHSFLAQKQVPADYTLPGALEKITAAGCAVENLGDAKVSMICFTTGKPLPKNWPGDLWLFVVDRSAIKDPPQGTSPQFATVNGVAVAFWTQGNKIYLLGVEGDEQSLRKYL